MSSIPLYQVDVFAERLFKGNPAAVCPLQNWLPDEQMQAIAAENNLSETAFFTRDPSAEADFHLRWFTPTVEIELCGHATLASGWVLFERLDWQHPAVRFRTLAGVLQVTQRDGALWLDLPARMPHAVKNVPGELEEGLGVDVKAVFGTGNKLMVVLERAHQVSDLSPDMAQLRRLAGKGVIVTAPGSGKGGDFVSRFFAPAMGVDEDPVTGSAHCLLVPYWAQRLGKTELHAMQLSARGGRLHCKLAGERVALSGPVVHYLSGEIHL